MIKSKIKICGVQNIKTLKCCIDNKIDYFGLIFYKKSPRYVTNNQAIKLLDYSDKKKISSVGVFVNESIDKLNQLLKILKLNYIQLHGNEDDDYIKYIKKNNDIKIIKVISLGNHDDCEKVYNFKNANFFLFDYKPAKNELPGGNAKKFDWKLIKGIQVDKKWFISGGINIKNINDINKYAIPYGIDISSGVEVKLGIKSNHKIESLIKIYESR